MFNIDLNLFMQTHEIENNSGGSELLKTALHQTVMLVVLSSM